MRFLAAAIALLFVGVASAAETHSWGIYPVFPEGKTLTYTYWINMTSGIPGMTPQVSKSVYRIDVRVHHPPEYRHTLVISMENVTASDSVASVGSSTDPLTLVPKKELEEVLKIPFTAKYEHGNVTSYSMSPRETPESKRIKLAFLRNLRVQVDKNIDRLITHPSKLPLTFNRTKETPVGNYSSHYIITSSPYYDFPKDHDVVNISRSDNFEGIPYQTYHKHHNFDEQGCPGVCKKDHDENRFGAGCPVEMEPYHTPMKQSFVQHHNLRIFNGKPIIDMIFSTETHNAVSYDQNMVVTIETLIRKTAIDSKPIVAEAEQKTYTDLDERNVRASEEEIKRHCKYTTVEQAVSTVREILNHLAKIIHKEEIDGEAKNVGEKLVLLQKALTVLNRKHLEEIQEKDIVSHDRIAQASEKDKIKRQIWLDNLALIGTKESVYFIGDMIKKSINEKHIGIASLWEIKNILEALPLNILKIDAETIKILIELTEALHDRGNPGFVVYYSASHMAVARAIRRACADSDGIPEAEKSNKSNYLRMLLKETDDDYKSSGCPRHEAKKFITDLIEKLKNTEDKAKRIIYIETLCRTGLGKLVLPTLKKYVNGYIYIQTPSYTDFVRSVLLNALHNLADKHPKEVKDIVFPICTNKTESPKIRTSACSVFIRCYPTLGDLQHIAADSWVEPSLEVGSWWTSTLETYGNSSIPCDQLIARRIKKVLPQAKRFAVGKQHSQNILHTFFDAVRGFGLQHRSEYTPSNESIVPATLYSALYYHADSLKDVLHQFSLNSQGFDSSNTYDTLLSLFNLRAAQDIPKSKESEIFPGVEVANRANEFWRFTMYERMFYSMSYYYMDDEEFHKDNIIDLLVEHIKNYFSMGREGIFEGHMVKLFLPSSYLSKSFPQSITYPVQFEMKNPLIISLRVKLSPHKSGYDADIKPTVYHSMVYTNEILSLGDCKRVGVYHEKRFAATYPIRVSSERKEEKWKFSYSFPELPKKIFTYYSESGTYASKYSLEPPSSSTDKRTIKTIPYQFARNNTFGLPGLPVFFTSVLSEDIHVNFAESPRSTEPLYYQLIKLFFNAGWRRKSVVISRQSDEQIFNEKSKVEINFEHHHQYVKTKTKLQSSNGDDWTKSISLDSHDERKYLSEESTVSRKMSELSHHQHNVTFTVKQISPKDSILAHFEAIYKHTLDKVLYTLLINFTAKSHGISFGGNSRLAAAFYNRPPLKYSEDTYGKQKGFILGSVRLDGYPSDKPVAIAKVLLSHIPLGDYLNKELQTAIPPEYYLPETHDQCLQDVKEGNSLSVACMKAIDERAIYNRAHVKINWQRDLPRVMVYLLDNFELAAQHTWFPNLSREKKDYKNRALDIKVTYINKLTDHPVVDIVVTKPTEEWKLHKVDTSFIQPISSIYSLPETYVHYYTNNTYPATCALMKESVRTYDLKTIPLPEDTSCSYILSAHCVEHKKFAVIVEPGKRKVVIYVGEHEIVLEPGKEWNYQIQFDHKSHDVKVFQPLILHEREELIVVTTKLLQTKTSILEFYAGKAGIRVTYDGQHVKIQVHPRYKGELCGLCSEYDGEVVREYRAPDRCLHKYPEDFVASNGIGSCPKPKEEPETMCSDDDYYHKDGKDEHEIDREKEYVPKMKRNKVQSRGDKYCFSTKPIPVCESRDVPKETEDKEVEFHCLPREDKNSRKLKVESKRRILGELETKRVDHKERITYPTKCHRS